MTTTLRFPLKKYLRSSSMDSQHWSTFISPSMAATLEISHQTRDGDIARLSITITHDSGYVDTMESIALHSDENAKVTMRLTFKDNIVMVKHPDGRFQITFTTNSSAIEFVDRARKFKIECVAANETIPLLRDGMRRTESSSSKLGSQSSCYSMPPPATQIQTQFSQSYKLSQQATPPASQKRKRGDEMSLREADSTDNIDIDINNDKLLTESIMRVIHEPDFVKLVDRLRSVDALRLTPRSDY
ncbi:hypothetical protein E3Q18_02074 [Wallemia mellicola]|uniref:Uncharacterized protein n=1 Tax=Wallemia mellicola TaxID=1708541 RepID=A0A4T0RUQ8_9BASI|nr:hypothetical protein E3Q23_01882 [Wallemia mellicola]TIB83256.1 hypothetical protein E3Q21_03012 [Wallemia mellicola]TIB86025.1 hypothetical protein E3Q20_03003 [Wallemia mellicola]TIB98410.1 hypothetical protein E3Q18_02074 [Wallemia mellicola]TIC05238.1 hypothetical protein E3Q16_02303 [Wallemia mellicola]